MNSYNCCKKNKIEFEHIESLSTLIKLVGEPSRLKILCILKQSKHCVCEIMEHLKLSQSLISHHLKDLKEAGIIQDEKKGLYVYYSLTKRGENIISSLFSL